jgi:type I restriction enzyme S subunit
VSEWRTVRLGSACEKIGSGATPRGGSEVYLATGISLIRSQNIYNDGFKRDGLAFISEKHARELESVNVQSDDVLLNITGDSVARVCQVPTEILPARVNQHVAIIRPKQGTLDARFLHYFLIHPQTQAHMLGLAGAGATRNALTKGMIESFEIKAPSFSEQRAIAAVLGSLDDKIELNRRMDETLEALAQSLFKSWFVDATQSSLPKGWRYAAIAELCEINSWTLGKGDQLDRIEYVEISEVMRGNIANIQSYERGEEPSRARRRLRHGDTVLSTVRPDRGAYFLCLNPSPNLIGSTGFAVLTPTKAPWSFIHAALTQADVFEFLGQQADGGAYPAVRPEIIGALEVAWPNSLELVEEFHRVCAPLYQRAELNRQESRTLAALRDALLPKLLSGEIRIDTKKYEPAQTN